MKKILEWFRSYYSSTQASTIVEYGIIAAGVALVLIAAIFVMGDSIELMFDSGTSALTTIQSNIDMGT